MQRNVYSGIFTALAATIAVGSVFIPALFIPLALVSTALFALVTALSSTKSSRITSQCVIFAFYIITLLVTGDPLPGLFILMIFFPVGLAVGIAFGAKRNLNSAGATSLLFSAVYFFLVFIVYAVSATYPDISITDAANGIKETFLPQIENLLSSLIEAQPDPSVYTNTYSVSTIASYIFSYVPTAFAIWCLFTSTVSFWILKRVFKSFSTDVSFAGTFSSFRVSRTGAFIYFFVSVISLFSIGSAVGAAALNYTAVMSLVFSYAGISLISFFLELKNISSVVRYLIIGILFVLGLMPFGLSYILSLLGLVDSYLDIRGKLMNSGY